MVETKTASALTSCDGIIPIYESHPEVIYGEDIGEADYLKLAKFLSDERRYSEAERVLAAALERHKDFPGVTKIYDQIRAERSRRFSIRQTALSNIGHFVDSLKGRDVITQGQLTAFEIKGWVRATTQGAHLVVQKAGEKPRKVQLTIDRRDVVKHFDMKKMPGQLVKCGFSFVTDLTDGLKIHLHDGREARPMLEIATKKVLQVLEGREGWLFLDNDTNRSADIFTGKHPALIEDGRAWAAFAIEAEAAVQKIGPKFCLAISPSKEDVFPEFHPYPAASVSLLDTVVSSLFCAGTVVSCPVRRLRQDAASYYKTDTHWSGVGAWIGVQDLLQKIGYTIPQAFRPDFSDVEVLGDLGSKLSPAQSSIMKRWAVNADPAQIVFDNRVAGAGCVKMFLNQKAPLREKVLIFGGSSSNQLSMIMSYLFREVTFINSPSTLPILDVVRHLLPDAVICQTNARYLKQCARVVKDISKSPLAKVDLPEGWRDQ